VGVAGFGRLKTTRKCHRRFGEPIKNPRPAGRRRPLLTLQLMSHAHAMPADLDVELCVDRTRYKVQSDRKDRNLERLPVSLKFFRKRAA